MRNYTRAQGQTKVHCFLFGVDVLTLINRLINRKSDLLMLLLKVTRISVRVAVCRDPLSRLNNIDTAENKGHKNRKVDANRLIDSHGCANT